MKWWRSWGFVALMPDVIFRWVIISLVGILSAHKSGCQQC